MMPVLHEIAIAALVLMADPVPKLDFTRSCRGSADGILGLKQDVETCIQTENAARDEVAKQWSSFPTADRASCSRLTTMSGGRGTYTELITCLEMKRESARLPKDDGGNVGPVMR